VTTPVKRKGKNQPEKKKKKKKRKKRLVQKGGKKNNVAGGKKTIGFQTRPRLVGVLPMRLVAKVTV